MAKKSEKSGERNKGSIKELAKRLKTVMKELDKKIETSRVYSVKNFGISKNKIADLKSYVERDLPVKLQIET